jgi:hypothetical protein
MDASEHRSADQSGTAPGRQNMVAIGCAQRVHTRMISRDRQLPGAKFFVQRYQKPCRGLGIGQRIEPARQIRKSVKACTAITASSDEAKKRPTPPALIVQGHGARTPIGSVRPLSTLPMASSRPASLHRGRRLGAGQALRIGRPRRCQAGQQYAGESQVSCAIGHGCSAANAIRASRT